MSKALGREELIKRVVRDGLYFYREYCEVRGCDFERVRASVCDLPMHAFPGGTPSCPVCSKKKRHPLGVESAYGLWKVEVYKINVELKE